MRIPAEKTPLFSIASQNVVAAALLLRAMPEPLMPEGRRVHQGLQGLLEHAVVQNKRVLPHSTTILGQVGLRINHP
jgi:hypothetical protein